MSITRKQLSAMGLEASQIDQIIEGHTETVSGLQDELATAKADAEKYKAEASKVKGLEKEIETLKKDLETAENRGAEYDNLKQEFEDYKADIEKKETEAVKAEKFRELLKDIGLSDKGIQMALKWQGVGDVEIDESGKITNAKDLKKAAKEDWAEYITTTREEGADVNTPPDSSATKMTIEEIDAIEDTTERQKAMLANHELFGI